MDIKELEKIMAALRSEDGCPWDRQQTKESLKPFIVEEAYEVLEAIDEQDPKALKEELGDLLFQIVFLSRLASERGEFDLSGVIEDISKKMISRHPHVFGGNRLETSDQVKASWDKHKKIEGKQKESIFEGVPKELPALLRARKLQVRASKVGFDWSRLDDVVKKLDEEIEEFKTVFSENKIDRIEDELGDVLFTLVNIARFIGVNPEEALRKTISKFISRFRHIEMAAREQGRELADMTLEEMDAIWEEAKKK